MQLLSSLPWRKAESSRMMAIPVALRWLFVSRYQGWGPPLQANNFWVRYTIFIKRRWGLEGFFSCASLQGWDGAGAAPVFTASLFTARMEERWSHHLPIFPWKSDLLICNDFLFHRSTELTAITAIVVADHQRFTEFLISKEYCCSVEVTVLTRPAHDVIRLSLL